MNLNKVIFAGRLAKDPELKTTPSGTKVCAFCVGSTKKFKSSNGAMNEVVEWANCVAFGRTAEVIAQYHKKGSPIYLEGRMQTRNYEDKEVKGRKIYRTEVIVDTFQFIPTGQKNQEPKDEHNQERPDTEKVVQLNEKEDDGLDYGVTINPDDIPF